MIILDYLVEVLGLQFFGSKVLDIILVLQWFC
jgi:hypothetical protein